MISFLPSYHRANGKNVVLQKETGNLWHFKKKLTAISHKKLLANTPWLNYNII